MPLSNAELRAKIDVHQDKPLIEWLNANRVRWIRDKKGRPITTLAAIEKVLFKQQRGDDEVDF